MAAPKPLLSLQLNGSELIVVSLQVAQASKRHLLLYIVSEVVASDEVAKDIGDKRAEEQPSVEHGLEGEALAQRKRLPPGGTQVAHATTNLESIQTFHLVEVRGEISIGSLEACATGGEMPVVLRIEIHGSPITEVVVVLEVHSRELF